MGRSDFYGWRLVGAFWVIVFINLAFAAYGSPVMNRHMAIDLHLSRSLAGLPYNLYTVMSAVPSILVALLVRSIGVRRTVTLGSLLIACGALAMATLVHSALGAALAFGVVVGFGVAAGGPLGVQPGVVHWFVRRRALALSIVYSAGGVGGFVAGRMLERLIAAWGGNWRAGWWLFAGLALLAALIAAVFVRDRPEDLGQVPDGIREPENADASVTGAAPAADAGKGAPPGGPRRALPAFITREVWSLPEVLRCFKFWVMVLALCGGSAGYTLFLSQGLLHLADLGHSATAAAAALGVATGSTLLGKVALGLFGDRIDPRYIWALTMAVFGIGLLVLVDARSGTSLYTFAICIGFGFGGGLVCLMAVLSNYYGARVFAAAAGVAAAMNTIVSFVASQLGGMVYDRLGSYAPTFYSLAAWCFLGAVALLLVQPPRRDARASALLAATGLEPSAHPAVADLAGASTTKGRQ